MLVRALHVEGFRNLAPTQLSPSPRFNVISGDNGQGKTNLLEAIYLVGTLRSFRTNHARELIRFDAEHAAVKARVETGGLERVYEVELEPRRKIVKLDGKTPRTLGDYFGGFNVVLFAPEDLRVPRGSPGGRRRFLDRSVFNRHVGFLGDAQKYARVLKTRNLVLREGTARDELLAVYDEQLATLGARVVAARRRYLDELAPCHAEAFEAITHTGLPVRLDYEAPPEVLAAGSDETALAQALRDAIAASRARDLARRATNVGPHVDDVAFMLADQPARAFASQGQLRALVLAWKTAEMRLLLERTGDSPVLLLDDVSSELDPSRNAFLFRFLAEIECQCFVTTTHAGHVLVTENRVDFQMVAGELRS